MADAIESFGNSWRRIDTRCCRAQGSRQLPAACYIIGNLLLSCPCAGQPTAHIP